MSAAAISEFNPPAIAKLTARLSRPQSGENTGVATAVNAGVALVYSTRVLDRL